MIRGTWMAADSWESGISQEPTSDYAADKHMVIFH